MTSDTDDGSDIAEDDAGPTVDDLTGTARDAMVTLVRALNHLTHAHQSLQLVSGSHDPVKIRDARQRVEHLRDVYASAHDHLVFTSDRENRAATDRYATAANRLSLALIAVAVVTVVVTVGTAFWDHLDPPPAPQVTVPAPTVTVSVPAPVVSVIPASPTPAPTP